MKQVIEGLRYDTETAQEIGNYSNNLGDRDFHNINESLYITKNGRFFLAGEGGPLTKYAQAAGNMTSGGERIIALSQGEALDWCEQHLDADEYEKYFQDMISEA